jgi:hypothetical protein
MMNLSISMLQMVLVVGVGGQGRHTNRAGGQQQQQQQSMAEGGKCWTCLILLLLLQQHRVLEE